MRSIGGALVFVCLMSLGIYMKFSRKWDASADALVWAHESIATCDTYAKNSTYLDDLCDRCHEDAFENAYRMGGRYSSGRFDEQKYFVELLEAMSDRAGAEGRKDVSEELAVFAKEVEFDPG